MSYQVSVNSKNVLIPIHLENRDSGIRMNEPVRQTDVAGAMVIFFAPDGKFSQDFFPLKISSQVDLSYLGEEWELLGRKADGYFSYYLGVPDTFFSGAQTARSISIELVGSSQFNGNQGYSGGADISLQSRIELPLIPSFLNLCERFFPTLLPHNFIDKYRLETFRHNGVEHLLLMTDLRVEPSERIPVSFGKHWDPKNWINAVVENLSPSPGETDFMTIQGGCFFSRQRKITHWFGGKIGLDEISFRAEAAKKIISMGAGARDAWVFWLEYREKKPMLSKIVNGPTRPEAGPTLFSIRHPMLYQFLSRDIKRLKFTAVSHLQANVAFAGLPLDEAAEALSESAEILMRFQHYQQMLRGDALGVRWPSEVTAVESDRQPVGVPEFYHLEFEGTVRDLFKRKGEILRALESTFDDTFGYAAWDGIGDPVRRLFGNYLTGDQRNTMAL